MFHETFYFFLLFPFFPLSDAMRIFMSLAGRKWKVSLMVVIPVCAQAGTQGL